MDTTHLVDHTYLVSLVVIAIVSVISALLHRYSHRVLKEDSPKSQFARWGTQFMMLVLVALWLNNFYGDARGREKRTWEIRQNHLVRLHSVLQTEAGGLSEISRRAVARGRVSSVNPGPEGGASELDALFAPDPLSTDLINHYPEYWDAKQQLLKDVQRQDTQAGEVVGHVSKMLNLPSDAEHRRLEIGRAFLEQCLGKGPGLTLTIRKEGGYRYSSLGGSGSHGAGHPPKDVVAAFAAFRSISPDSETVEHGEALVKGAADISVKANQLARLAKLRAERASHTGDCEYTTLE